jgi:hypothetical protein
MTPAKRGQATPASRGVTRTAPDVPIVANPPPGPPAGTDDGGQLLGPEGEPLAHGASAEHGRGDASPPTEAGQVNADDRATQARRRPGGLYPLPVWPD